MARPWRIEYEGAYYHILLQGNDRKEIFYGDEDKTLFLETVGEMSDRFEVDVFAFVLMSNHYHLLLRTRLANLSKAMQWLGLIYSRRFNNRHGRSGHLFQGRFKSIVVENEAYMIELSCYIHRNPVRAGMAQLHGLCLRPQSPGMVEHRSDSSVLFVLRSTNSLSGEGATLC